MSDLPGQIYITEPKTYSDGETIPGTWVTKRDWCFKHEYRRADLPPTISAALELPEVNALAEALRVALDYVEGCKVNNIPDLGVASRLPFMDDVLKLGDAAIAALEPKP